jgi:hypothetical protein
MAKDEIIKLRELASKLLGTEWDYPQKQKRTFFFLENESRLIIFDTS